MTKADKWDKVAQSWHTGRRCGGCEFNDLDYKMCSLLEMDGGDPEFCAGFDDYTEEYENKV
tara:strand:- start:1456 stop:1638 length:183 start_codon:yes stop_codon:yes gene_type:complete